MSAEAIEGLPMSMPAQQPEVRRPGLLVYGLLMIVACCLPALLLTSLF
ncbi:MAG: hypothetical protein ACOH1H_14685 [Brevundimonas sp.]|jgi:hypothetical protein